MDDERKTPGKGAESESGHGEFAPAKRILYNVTIEAADTYIYSNVAGISIAPWDIRINFAEVQPRGDQVVSKTVAGIVMPPEHAAALAMLLLAQLHHFEAQFGAIRHPEWVKMKSESSQLQEPAVE
jgi:hypothetical protein